jgi:hypothetical protein
MDGVLLKVCNWKEGCCTWSLVATTSCMLALSLLLLSNLMNVSLSLFVLNPCLTFLNSACTTFTLNQVYSLVHIYHRAISWWFHKRLPFCPIKCSYTVDFEQVPYMVLVRFWAMSLWAHTWLYIPILFGPSKRISSLIVPIIDLVWKFLPQLGILSLTLEFEKVLFPFRASARVVGPRRPSNEAQHK